MSKLTVIGATMPPGGGAAVGCMAGGVDCTAGDVGCVVGAVVAATAVVGAVWAPGGLVTVIVAIMLG